MLGEFISQQRCSELEAQARARAAGLAAPWLQFDEEELNAAYNRRPFQLRHRLADHPLMTLPALFALCRRLPRQQVAHRAGVVPVDTDFDASFVRFRQDLTLEEALDQFEPRRAYLCVSNPERDPAYRPLLETLLGEIALQTSPLDSVITWYSTYFFISSQDSVTPYHMDREMNFLLQIRGEKTVMLWDPADEAVMSEQQKDRLLSYDGERPAYDPRIESRAMRYALRPGLGVHHPFIAPHRVHTGSAVSISLAFTFRTRQSDMWTRAHQFNHKLRQLGLQPRAVGRNALVDGTKAELLQMMRRTRTALRKPERATA